MALRLHFLVFPLLIYSTVAQQPPLSTGENDDVRSLLEFKKGIRDDPSGLVLGSWNESSPLEPDGCPSSWHGVMCEGNGVVVGVALDGIGLSGDLKFSTLVGMRSLRNLSLSGNNLTGRLVPTVGSMASLQHLDLSGNRFYGPVPRRITELWGLVYLNLSRNGFTGGFPGGMRNLQQLRVLDVSQNSLRGDVGDIFSELRNVEHLDLSNNIFHGMLTMETENLSSLANTAKTINVSYNKISGAFFTNATLPLFKNLEILDVSYNQLNGELPSFDVLPNLRVLRAGNNQLFGPLQAGLFGSSIALLELDLSGNGFTGQIFAINSTSLKVLNLSSNALSGSLPAVIGSCKIVDLSMNLLSGDLSWMENWGSTIEVVDLSSNMLSGNIPNNTFQFQGLTSLKMRNNSLVGSLPSVLELGHQLSVVDLSLNKLTGTLFPSLLISLSLTYLNLSANQFTGNLPIQAPHSTESLAVPSLLPMEFLDLSDNSLSGSLPPEIAELQKLKYLDLGKNSFSGEIPVELASLNDLEVLDLSMNDFKGKIPDFPQINLKKFDVAYNDLSGLVPEHLRKFDDDSFHPGNALLVLPGRPSYPETGSGVIGGHSEHRQMKSRILVAIIVGSIGAVVLIFFIFMAVYMIATQELCGKNGFREYASGREVKLARFSPSNIFRFHKSDAVQNSVSFSNDQLLTSASRALPAQKEMATGTVERGFSNSREIGFEPVQDGCSPTGGLKASPGSPLTSSPHSIRNIDFADQPVVLDVYSPDRLAGELFFLDNSLTFTAEDLSRAPAEVLGRSSHGTSYKATMDTGHTLTVKWLRVGLVRRKKEFSKEVKKIGSIRHQNIVPLRSYYWGPREQERLILSDYINGDSLALHLHESTPRRHSPLSLTQRLKITIDIARGLVHLHHDRGLPHGNLKPANILLNGPDLTAQLTDYCLHRLMTPNGTSEQMLNLGALGYAAPELAGSSRPFPTVKADVYAFGVIMMELLTRRSAGDIISGQSGAVDLTDWVRMCVREGRGAECFDRDIAVHEENLPKAMDELLAVSLRCILPVNERPSMRTVFEDLCSIVI